MQVANLILCGNTFTAKGLNSLLTCLKSDMIWIDRDRLKEFRFDDLEWNVSTEYANLKWSPSRYIQNDQLVDHRPTSR